MAEFPESELFAINECIRNDSLTEAHARLNSALKKRWARSSLHRVANLCRRLGLAATSLRYLNLIIYPKNSKAKDATDDEILEYASALIHLGCTGEADALLSQLKSESAEASLQHAFIAMKMWDYAKAQDFLSHYLKFPRLSSYRYAIGKVNYLATLIALDDFHNAEILIEKIKNGFKEAGYKRLLGNTLELELQLCIQTENWKRADDITIAPDDLYFLKWKAIGSIKQYPKQKSVWVDELKRLKVNALEIHDWESARDCDFHIAVATRNKKLAEKVYAGTPYPLYRSRILRAFKKLSLELNLGVDWQGNFQNGADVEGILDLTKLQWNENPIALKEGGILEKSLHLLFDDFYSAPTLAQFHERLFPDRHYHPDHSPVVIHQTLSRLKKLGREEGLPFHHEVEGNFIQFKIAKDFCLVKHLEAPSITNSRQILQFREEKTELDFRSQELATFLKISQRQAERLIKKELAKGTLKPIGIGRRSRYKFAA